MCARVFVYVRVCMYVQVCVYRSHIVRKLMYFIALLSDTICETDIELTGSTYIMS